VNAHTASASLDHRSILLVRISFPFDPVVVSA
jgi:hypothetical protein